MANNILQRGIFSSLLLVNTGIVYFETQEEVFPGLWYKQLPLSKGLNSKQAQTIFDYYENGGQENFKRLFAYLNHTIFKVTDKVA